MQTSKFEDMKTEKQLCNRLLEIIERKEEIMMAIMAIQERIKKEDAKSETSAYLFTSKHEYEVAMDGHLNEYTELRKEQSEIIQNLSV